MNHLVNKARTLVSADKFRFTKDGFNLDLVYVTPRIIAMGFPADGAESAWRNDIDEVARFFKTYHNDHFLILNLSEKTYDVSKFDNRVQHFGWTENYAPPLLMLINILEAIDMWLTADPVNVVAVHCRTGRGRTGVVIASYFAYKRMFPTPQECVKIFNRARSAVGDGVVVPSQVRAVKYIDELMKGSISRVLLNTPTRLRLHKILMRPVPLCDIGGKGCRPWFEVYQGVRSFNSAVPLFSSKPERKFVDEDYVVSLSCDIDVEGDIVLKFYHRQQMKSVGIFSIITHEVPIFRCYFHTSFVTHHFLDLSLKELDAEDRAIESNDTRFQPGFMVRILFSDTS
jgi:protein-tyrosine phosphatase